MCNRNTLMWWWRRDVAIASPCTEATFSFTGDDEAKCIEGVETFKYLGWMLDRSDNNWPEVRQNVHKVCQVWSRLGKLLPM